MFEFVHNVSSETVRINGELFPIKKWLELVPDYEIPSGTSLIHYIPGKKHYIIQNGIPTSKSLVWNAGDFYISKHNDLKIYCQHTQSVDHSKKEDKNNIINPNDPYCVNRKKEYPHINELIVAMWEHIVEGKTLDDSDINRLESIRSAVKKRFPNS